MAEAKSRDRGDNDDEVSGMGGAAAAAAVPKSTAQRSFTDPDPRIMKTADASCHHCCNGQAVVDADHLVVIATELNPIAVDMQQLLPMIQNTHQMRPRRVTGGG